MQWVSFRQVPPLCFSGKIIWPHLVQAVTPFDHLFTATISHLYHTAVLFLAEVLHSAVQNNQLVFPKIFDITK